MIGTIGGLSDATLKKRCAAELEKVSKALKEGDDARAAQIMNDVRAILAEQDTPNLAAKLLPIWRDARETADRQLNDLQAALRQRGQPISDRIADAGFNGITDGQLTRMQTTLMEFDDSAGEARQAARARVSTANKSMAAFWGDNKILPLLEANPLNVSVTVRATLAQALRDINRTIG